ncbi:MAG: twitching motility protein PilT [Acidobacteria bacterium]|nr:twitching motility protein PilT [Acidobacteriota bacterium]
MIVVDTHAWLWWLDDRTFLSPAARHALQTHDLLVSPISFWEIGMLAQKGRIKLGTRAEEWLQRALDQTLATTVPITVSVAVLAASLPDPIRDPADRLIVATALDRGVPLVTKDERIARAGVVETIW